MMSSLIHRHIIPHSAVSEFLRQYDGRLSIQPEEWASGECQRLNLGELIFCLQRSTSSGVPDERNYNISELWVVAGASDGHRFLVRIKSDTFELCWLVTAMVEQAQATKAASGLFYYVTVAAASPLSGEKLSMLEELGLKSVPGGLRGKPDSIDRTEEADPVAYLLDALGFHMDASNQKMPVSLDLLGQALLCPQNLDLGSQFVGLTDVLKPVPNLKPDHRKGKSAQLLKGAWQVPGKRPSMPSELVDAWSEAVSEPEAPVEPQSETPAARPSSGIPDQRSSSKAELFARLSSEVSAVSSEVGENAANPGHRDSGLKRPPSELFDLLEWTELESENRSAAGEQSPKNGDGAQCRAIVDPATSFSPPELEVKNAPGPATPEVIGKVEPGDIPVSDRLKGTEAVVDEDLGSTSGGADGTGALSPTQVTPLKKRTDSDTGPSVASTAATGKRGKQRADVGDALEHREQAGGTSGAVEGLISRLGEQVLKAQRKLAHQADQAYERLTSETSELIEQAGKQETDAESLCRVELADIGKQLEDLMKRTCAQLTDAVSLGQASNTERLSGHQSLVGENEEAHWEKLEEAFSGIELQQAELLEAFDKQFSKRADEDGLRVEQVTASVNSRLVELTDKHALQMKAALERLVDRLRSEAQVTDQFVERSAQTLSEDMSSLCQRAQDELRQSAEGLTSTLEQAARDSEQALSFSLKRLSGILLSSRLRKERQQLESKVRELSSRLSQEIAKTNEEQDQRLALALEELKHDLSDRSAESLQHIEQVGKELDGNLTDVFSRCHRYLEEQTSKYRMLSQDSEREIAESDRKSRLMAETSNSGADEILTAYRERHLSNLGQTSKEATLRLSERLEACIGAIEDLSARQQADLQSAREGLLKSHSAACVQVLERVRASMQQAFQMIECCREKYLG